MKKTLGIAAGLVFLTFVLVNVVPSFGQADATGGQGRQATTSQSKSTGVAPYRVGLVNLEKVFKSYPKFDAAQKTLQAEAKAKQEKLTQMRAQFKDWVDQHRNPELKQTPGNVKGWEEEATRKEAEIAAEEQNAKRDLMKRESNLYATVYQDVTDVVEYVAKRRGLAMVMRFSDDPVSPSDPDSVVKGLSRHVLYLDQSADITSQVIATLNRTYENAQAPAAGRQPAGN